VLVLEGEPQLHPLRLERPGRAVDGVDCDLLPASQPVALRPALAVDEDRSGSQEPLGLGA